MATVSYVRITGANNAVLSGDGAVWAPVYGVSFGAAQSIAFNGGDSTGAGKATLGDLTFALSQSSSLSPQLKLLLAQGQALKVEVATYDNSTATTGSAGTLQSYQVFGNVTPGAGLAGLHTETLNSGVADVYTVTPGSISQTTYPSGMQPSASAFDTGANRAINPVVAPTDVAAGTIKPSTAPSQTSLTYYAEFKDASGNYVTGANGSTWFAITGLSSEIEQTLNVASTAGTGAGQVVFDSASFTLADNSLDPKLFQSLTSGSTLKDVQIEAIANGQVVDSTTLGTVQLSTKTQGSATGTTVSLGYGSYYTQHVGAGGTTGSGYDRINKKSLTSTAADPIIQLSTASAVQAPASSYFVSFVTQDGTKLNGDSSTSVAGPLVSSASSNPLPAGKLFAATDVSFQVEQKTNIGSQSSGSGAGRVSFDPLYLTVAATPQSTAVDSVLFSGKPFSEVDLGSSASGQLSELDRYKLVAISSDNLDLIAGTHAFSLSYGAMQQQTAAAQNAGGSVTSGVPAAWNRVSNNSDLDAGSSAQGTVRAASVTPAAKVAVLAAAPSNPNVTVTPAASAQAPAPTTNTAYVQFRDASGNVITGGANGASWFKLSSATTSFEQPINIGSQSTGAGTSKPSLDSLALALGPDAVTAQLDKMLGTTGGITAEVASYANGALANDYVFGGSSLTVDAPSATGSSLSLSYRQVQETSYAPGVAASTVTWNSATNTSAYSAKVAAPTSGKPNTLNTPSQLATYAEFVDANGRLITSGNQTLFAVKNADVQITSASGTGKPTVGDLTLQIGDDGAASILQAGLGSKTTPVGVVLVSVDARNPSNFVSQQTFGDVYLSGDTLDNQGGDNTLTFSSAAASGTAYSSTLAPAGYTEQIADDYRPNGYSSFSTAAGGALPSLAGFSKGLPSRPPTYQSFSGESFSAEVGTGDGSANLTGTASDGFLSASNVSVDFAGKIGTFSVAATALPALTQALAAGRGVTVSLQNALNGNSRTLTFGGGSGNGVAALTGAALNATTGLADVSFSFSAPPSVTAVGTGGGVKGVDSYQDQLIVAPEQTGTMDEVAFDVSFTNKLVPVKDLSASDLQIVDGTGSTVKGTISSVAKQSDGTYVAIVTGLTGSGAFSIDGTDEFKESGVSGHTLVAALQSGSVSVTTGADSSQSIAVTTSDPQNTTTTKFSPKGVRTQTLVIDPDPSTSQLITNYGPDGTTPTSTASLLTDGTYVVVTPGNSGDPSGAGGSTTNTYASEGGTLLTTTYQRADGTLAERVDNTGAGVRTSIYAADGTTPVSVTTLYGDGTKEVFQALTSGPYASSDDIYDANGMLTQATYARADGTTAEVDTFANGTKTVTLYDANGNPITSTPTQPTSPTSDPAPTNPGTMSPPAAPTSPTPVGTQPAPVPAPSPSQPSQPTSPALPAPVTVQNGDGSTSTTTHNADGTTTTTTEGGSRFNGTPLSSVEKTYAADGTLLNEVRDLNGGPHRVSIYQGSQKLQSDFFDTFNNGAAPDNTFVFDPGHGLDIVNLFRVGGTDHDTLSFLGSDFGSTPQAQLASVLANTHNVQGGVVIVDPTTKDKLFLSGLHKGQLAANQGDFTFHT